jgi:hypothetical protein
MLCSEGARVFTFTCTVNDTLVAVYQTNIAACLPSSSTLCIVRVCTGPGTGSQPVDANIEIDRETTANITESSSTDVDPIIFITSVTCLVVLVVSLALAYACGMFVVYRRGKTDFAAMNAGEPTAHAAGPQQQQQQQQMPPVVAAIYLPSPPPPPPYTVPAAAPPTPPAPSAIVPGLATS